MPLILIDLKGAAFSQPVIDKLWELVLDLAIVDYTALYILDPAQLALAQHSQWRGPLIRCWLVSGA